MLKLLKDSQTGFGDTFVFEKTRMINVLESAHMRATDISGAPEKFLAYELAQARMFFNAYHNDFFKSFYFGIARCLPSPCTNSIDRTRTSIKTRIRTNPVSGSMKRLPITTARRCSSIPSASREVS